MDRGIEKKEEGEKRGSTQVNALPQDSGYHSATVKLHKPPLFIPELNIFLNVRGIDQIIKNVKIKEWELC